MNMAVFLRKSTEWTNARLTYVKQHMKTPEYMIHPPFARYQIWLKQFGAKEVGQNIVVNDDADAVAFKLRFGYNKV
jgi:hypothetical protein